MIRGAIRLCLAVGIICLICTTGCGDTSTNSNNTASAKGVYQFKIQDRTRSDGRGELRGHYYDIKVTQERGSKDIGRFDFKIAYDTAELAFVSATQGYLFTDCGWQMFGVVLDTVQTGCVSDCPSGIIHIQGAPFDQVGWEPSCYRPDSLPALLFTLSFLARHNPPDDYVYSRIHFYWSDCSDNSVYLRDDNRQIVSNAVYDIQYFNGSRQVTSIENRHYNLPGWFGTPDSCPYQARTVRERSVDFWNGGIDLMGTDSARINGDLNCNGVANEYNDAVTYINYFVEGMGVFDEHTDCSMAASDVNRDGVTLSIADLQYMIRIIAGDAEYYQPPLDTGQCAVNYSHANGQFNFNYASTRNIGIMRLACHVSYSVGIPITRTGGMDMLYHQTDSILNVLMYNIGSNIIPAGSGNLITIPLDGNLTVDSISAADFWGYPIKVTIVPPTTKERE